MSPFLEAVATHCITHVVCCTNTFQREHPLQYHRVTAWLNTCQYYKQRTKTSVSQNSGTVRGASRSSLSDECGVCYMCEWVSIMEGKE